MADSPPQAPPAGAKQPGPGAAGKRENVFTRKIGPLPAWVWMAIAAALVLAYALWKGKSSPSSSSSGGGGKGTATSGALVPPVLEQGAGGQDDDDDGDRRRHRRRKHGGGGGKKEGPEREWLERKTGSDRPWTYLARHHEQIRVGPHGSRIVHGSDPRRRRHRRDHDEATENTATATRAAPGQPAGGVTGQLMSFTVPQSGPAPSLSQVAAQYNTAPDAIVEEATGRGSPHGALWHRYVAANDWDAPLPHGTDLTVLAQPN